MASWRPIAPNKVRVLLRREQHKERTPPQPERGFATDPYEALLEAVWREVACPPGWLTKGWGTLRDQASYVTFVSRPLRPGRRRGSSGYRPQKLPRRHELHGEDGDETAEEDVAQEDFDHDASPASLTSSVRQWPLLASSRRLRASCPQRIHNGYACGSSRVRLCLRRRALGTRRLSESLALLLDAIARSFREMRASRPDLVRNAGWLADPVAGRHVAEAEGGEGDHGEVEGGERGMRGFGQRQICRDQDRKIRDQRSEDQRPKSLLEATHDTNPYAVVRVRGPAAVPVGRSQELRSVAPRPATQHTVAA